MPLEAAVSAISLAQENLRYTLADCARFRTLTGAANQAEALARIYHDALPPPAAGAADYTLAEWATYRPFAIVFTDRRGGFRRTKRATYATAEQGKLGLHLEMAIAAGDVDEPGQAVRVFTNHAGKIIDELFEKSELGESGGVSYLQINEINFVGPFRADEDDAPGHGNYIYGLLEISWGVDV